MTTILTVTVVVIVGIPLSLTVTVSAVEVSGVRVPLRVIIPTDDMTNVSSGDTVYDKSELLGPSASLHRYCRSNTVSFSSKLLPIVTV